MQHSSRTSILDAHVRAAWQEQIAAARQRPGLLPELVRRRDELPPRFAAHYIQLRALPRRVRRALQRQLRMPLAGVALMLALGQTPGLAATIPVNANCTLVNAITAANTDSATGGCPAGNGADTIVLPAGSTQTLTSVNNSTYGPTGLPVISSVITIAGQGSTISAGQWRTGVPDCGGEQHRGPDAEGDHGEWRAHSVRPGTYVRFQRRRRGERRRHPHRDSIAPSRAITSAASTTPTAAGYSTPAPSP